MQANKLINMGEGKPYSVEYQLINTEGMIKLDHIQNDC